METENYFTTEFNATMKEISGQVGLPDGYFLKMAKADYRDYRSALWREIYQNSLDAGASKITVSWDASKRSITITDNGCGMSLDTLQNKLLVLGGSKKAEGSTGAFGKAKELELFSWERYELWTKNLLLTGAGDQYTIVETPEYLDGCKITLIIQEGEDFDHIVGYAKIVAQKIESDCEFMVNDEVIGCTAPKGELRKTLDSGSIFVNEELSTSNYAKVRMNGIWMFDMYAGQDTPHITMELSGNSVASLNSNRDGMKNSCLEEANRFFGRLASDRMSALFPDKEEILLHAEGTEGNTIKVTDDDMSFLEQRFGNLSKEEFMEGFAQFIAENSEGDLDVALAKLRTKDLEDICDYTRMKFFGFKWDTVHKFTKGQEETAKSFIDGSTAKAHRAKTLLTMWGETLKQVMLDNEMYHSFTVGFNWDEDQQAQFHKENDGLTFYLNPNILSHYPLNNKKGLVRKMKQLACHEVAHYHNEYHDEYFVTTMEDMQEGTWKSDRLYARITKIK